MSEVKLIILSSDEIKLSDNELSARLHMPVNCFPKLLDSIIEDVRLHIECKCVYRQISFTIDGNTVLFPFGSTNSISLARFLMNCKSSVFTVITLGIGLERYISSIPEEDVSKKMLTDAVASAFAESACDKFEEMISKEYGEITGRFSPGYGDLSLDFQPVLLEQLNARKLIGVTLNDSLMMIPRKTVSAIIGVNTNE